MKSLLILALIPLILSIGIIPVLPLNDAFALKSKGNSLPEVGSNKVCGDRLCSEVIEDKSKPSEPKQETETEMLRVDIVRITEKISMLIGANGFTGGNIGVLTGNDGLLLIDDGLASALDGIKLQLAELKTCDTCGDVKFLINTHWHGDHVGGNSHFGEQGAVIIAHENLRKLLSAPQTLEFYGVTYDAYPDEALPVVTFEDSIYLYFNDETLQVIHLPNGHTDNDSMVYFVESGVLHLGDEFFNGMFPFVDLDHGGSVQGLTRNIEDVLDRFPEDTKVIPGHGKLGTMNDVKIFHEMLVETTKIVQAQINDEKSLEEIQNNGLPEKWQSWEKGNIKIPIWIEFIYNDLTNNKKISASTDDIELEKYRTAELLSKQHLKTFDELDFEVFTKQQWERLHESHSQDIVVHWPDGRTTVGIEPHIEDLKAMFVYAPDTRIQEHPIKIASGPWTSVIGIIEGTFTEPMPLPDGTSIPPTGKSFKLTMATVGYWEDGVMTEEYLFWDNLEFMKQIGLA